MDLEAKHKVKLIGHIKEAFGLRGDILVYVRSKDISWADDLSEVFLVNPQEPGILKSFEVEKWRPHKSGLSLKLKGVDDRNGSEKLRSFLVYIDQDLLISKPGETIFLSEILNFKVLESDTKFDYGTIVGFSSNGAQDLLEIKNANGVFQAPFVEAFISKIDFELQILWVRFPEGLDPNSNNEDGSSDA